MTGVHGSKKIDWRASQRFRLYRVSHPKGEEAKVLVPILMPTKDGRGWSPELARTGQLAKELLDIEMVGAAQCELKSVS